MAEKRKARAKRKSKSVPLTPEQVILSRRRRLADQEEVSSFFTRLTAMAVLMAILFGLVFGVTPMRNDDMLPRISAGDLMLYYRLENNWHIKDVVVFEMDGESYTGRIVAQGGDTVEVTEDAQLILNGSTVMESDIYYSTPRYESDVTYPLTLEEGQFFILCDYREGARDSRYFGAVDQEAIKGKVITVIRRSSL